MEEARGERLLLAAILLRAVRDVVAFSCSQDRVQRALAQEASEWLFEEVDGSDRDLTSFASICVLTDLDRERVRLRVRALLAAAAVGDLGERGTALVQGALAGRCEAPDSGQVRGQP